MPQQLLSEALRAGERRLGAFWRCTDFGESAAHELFSDLSYPVACVFIAHEVGPIYWSERERLRMIYPWIEGVFQCPWCAENPQYEEILTHPFDRHIRHGDRTFGELIDWIVAIEPVAEFHGRDATRGIYLRFERVEDLQLVRLAARCTKRDVNEFITSSAVYDAGLRVPFAKRNRKAVAGLPRPDALRSRYLLALPADDSEDKPKRK